MQLPGVLCFAVRLNREYATESGHCVNHTRVHQVNERRDYVRFSYTYTIVNHEHGGAVHLKQVCAAICVPIWC